MPRGDRTGPMGDGPMTGRAAGYCAGYTTPGYANPAGGRGMGRGFGGGFGRGMGRGFGRTWAAPSQPVDIGPQPEPVVPPTDAVDTLLARTEDLARSLERVTERLDSLEAAKQNDTAK